MKKSLWVVVAMSALFFSCQNAQQGQNDEASGVTSDATYTRSLIGSSDKILRLSCEDEAGNIQVALGDVTVSLSRITTASGVEYKNEEYTLTQWQGETTLKQGETILFSQFPRDVKGVLSLGQEIFFTPEGESVNYLITNSRPQIEEELTSAEITINDTGIQLEVALRVVPVEYIQSDNTTYAGAYEIVKVIEAKEIE